jgi:hypothetical protein
MTKRRVGVEYSPSMLEPVRPGAMSPDRALCLPTFISFVIVNKTSLSLSLSLFLFLHCLTSLFFGFEYTPPPPPPPPPPLILARQPLQIDMGNLPFLDSPPPPLPFPPSLLSHLALAAAT